MQMKALSFLPGAIALLVAATPVVPAFTQAAAAAPRLAQAGGRHMGNKLNLTDTQKAQIKQIRESARQQMEQVLTDAQKAQIQQARQNRQKPNLNLTEDQKSRMKTIRQNADSQIRALLTTEQQQQWDQMKQQRQQRWQQRQPQSGAVQ